MTIVKLLAIMSLALLYVLATLADNKNDENVGEENYLKIEL